MGFSLTTLKKYLVPLFVFLAIAAFLVLVYVAISPDKKTETPTLTSTVPKQDLYTVNAQVVKVDAKAKKITAKSIVPTGWNKQWVLVMGNETKLGTLDSWWGAEQARIDAHLKGLSEVKQKAAFDKKFKEIKLSTLKSGHVIYVIADDDFAKKAEIKKLKAILLQTIE